MPLLEDRQLETFTQDLARGVSPVTAALQNDYIDGAGESSTRAARPEVQARKTEILRERAGAISDDPQSIINFLMDIANAAFSTMNPPGYAVALRALVEVSRLKRVQIAARAGEPAAIDAPESPWVRPEPILGRREWLARFAPQPG